MSGCSPFRKAVFMKAKKTTSSDPTLARLPGLLPELEALYTDVHAHPELSMQETRTAGLAAERLRAAGYDVTTAIGKTGVVGLLRNGSGPTVMLRRHGRVAGREGDRPALCQQTQGQGPRREDGAGDASSTHGSSSGGATE